MLRYEKNPEKLSVWEAEGISKASLERFQVAYDSFSDRLVYPIRNVTGEIVNVCADESILTDGKIDVRKLRPISFDPMGSAYFGVGDKVGRAFSDGARLKSAGPA
jgi:hypothetical protein